MIGGCNSIAQCGSGTQGVYGSFRRNTFLANTALILLCDIWGVVVDSCGGRKLLGGQTDRYSVPELVLSLSLAKSHKRTPAKDQFGKVEGNIKPLCQRL